MVRLKFGGYIEKQSKVDLKTQGNELSDRAFCYSVLNKVSRSFAVVIRNLPLELMDAVCIFYLILRGLDSVEDDMRKAHLPNKERMLREFHEYLDDPTWSVVGVGDTPDYEILLEYFPKVTREYQRLKPKYREVVADITKRMGAGMADFALKVNNGKGSIEKVEEYNLYCHYVAGLVGHGLIALFAASGLEHESLAKEHKVANSMGMFLQKANIIRDYLEDLDDGRTWWPKDIWGQYGKSLGHFRGDKLTKRVKPEAMECLNALVTDALDLVPDVIDFLNKIKNPEIFAFCAIPQVMAMATLTKVYNNPKVFLGVVKIRKGISARIMLETKNINDAKNFFNDFACQLEQKVLLNSKSKSKSKAMSERESQMNERTIEKCKETKQLTSLSLSSSGHVTIVSILGWLFMLALVLFVCNRVLPAGPATQASIESMGLRMKTMWLKSSTSWVVVMFAMAWVSMPVLTTKRRATV